VCEGQGVGVGAIVKPGKAPEVGTGAHLAQFIIQEGSGVHDPHPIGVPSQHA
jgi:hypothetical protein